MRPERNVQPEAVDRTREEVERLAQQLAEHGFYVVGALLPDETWLPPNQANKLTN